MKKCICGFETIIDQYNVCPICGKNLLKECEEIIEDESISKYTVVVTGEDSCSAEIEMTEQEAKTVARILKELEKDAEACDVCCSSCYVEEFEEIGLEELLQEDKKEYTMVMIGEESCKAKIEMNEKEAKIVGRVLKEFKAASQDYYYARCYVEEFEEIGLEELLQDKKKYTMVLSGYDDCYKGRIEMTEKEAQLVSRVLKELEEHSYGFCGSCEIIL